MITNRRPKRIPRAGFTFLEVIIAISILTMISAVAYTSLAQMIRTKKGLDDIRDTRAFVDAVMSRVIRELQRASSSSVVFPPQNSLNSPYPGGPNFVAKAKDGSKGEITFVASEGGQYLPDGGVHSGLVQIRYKLVENPEKKDLFVLVREEIPYTKPEAKAYKRIMTFPIIDNLVSLTWRFYDQKTETWYREWGTTPLLKLPAIVEISFTVRSPQGTDSSFSTAISLRGG